MVAPSPRNLPLLKTKLGAIYKIELITARNKKMETILKNNS